MEGSADDDGVRDGGNEAVHEGDRADIDEDREVDDDDEDDNDTLTDDDDHADIGDDGNLLVESDADSVFGVVRDGEEE